MYHHLNGRPGVSAVRLSAFGTFVVVALVMMTSPAVALDLFTLWRQPEIPLHITEGDWVDYRTQVMAGGRKEIGIIRVACLNRDEGSDDDSFLLELLPMHEQPDGSLLPMAGEGAQVRLDRNILLRDRPLLASVISVRNWQNGEVREITPEELREDPLLSTSFQSNFIPDEVSNQQSTTRVVAGQQFTCRQWILASADTQSVIMPAGKMKQISSREIAAAVYDEVPFLGLVYASERVRAVSTLDPPNRKIPVPPARIRVEIMELVGFGHQATAHLTGSH